MRPPPRSTRTVPARSSSDEMDMDTVPAADVEAIELGLDFGTGNISFVYRLRFKNDTTTGVATGYMRTEVADIPACVAYHNGDFFYGHELVEHVEKDKEPHVPAENVIQCYKMLFYDGHGSEMPDVLSRAKTALFRAEKNLDQLLTDHLAHLYRDMKLYASAQFGGYTSAALMSKPLSVRLGCPQMWGPRARKRMITASKNTGLVTITELASEPQAFLAAHLDHLSKSNGLPCYRARDLILVVDMGCGTIDFVLYRLTDELNVKSRLEAVEHSAGCPRGSYFIDENMVQHVKDQMGGGVNAARKMLNMGIDEYRWRLLRAAERVKTNPSRPFNDRITVINGDGLDVGHTISRAEIQEASRPTLDGVCKIIDEMTEVAESLDTHIKTMILCGGLRKSTYMTTSLHKKYNTDKTAVIKTASRHEYDNTMVAEGMFSERYPVIRQAVLPTQFSYAVLRDEYLNKTDHKDCYHKNGKFDMGRIARSPYDSETDLAIDRLEMLIHKGQRPAGTIKSSRSYWTPTAKPIISDRFVYCENDHANHEPALADGYDVGSSDNKFRPGIYEWAVVEAELSAAELDAKAAEVKRAPDGLDYYVFDVSISCDYKDEESLSWSWVLHLPGGPVPVEGKEIWDSKASLFSEEHDNLGSQESASPEEDSNSRVDSPRKRMRMK